MKILNLVRGDRKYKAYIAPDGYGRYEYMLYEIVPKKHWWSFRSSYVGSGTIWNDIEEEILAHIERGVKKEDEINRLAEQFNKL